MPGPLGDGVGADVVGKADNHECLSADVGCHPLVEGLDFIDTLVADKIGPDYGLVQARMLEENLQGVVHFLV